MDTNLLVYAEGVHDSPGDRAKAATMQRLIDHLPPEDIVIPAQMLGELTVVLLRRGARTRNEARNIVLRWREIAGLVPGTNFAIIGSALDLSTAHDLQSWDSISLCAAAEASSSLLLSKDMQDGFVRRGVTVANPFAEPRHPLLISALA